MKSEYIIVITKVARGASPEVFISAELRAPLLPRSTFATAKKTRRRDRIKLLLTQVHTSGRESALSATQARARPARSSHIVKARIRPGSVSFASRRPLR